MDDRHLKMQKGRVLFMFLFVIAISLNAKSQNIDTVIDGHKFNYFTKIDTLICYGSIDKKGNRFGYWIFLEQNGCIKKEGNYCNNKETGTWYFYKEGLLRQTGNYVRGMKRGIWYVGGASFIEFKRNKKVTEYKAEPLIDYSAWNGCRLQTK